MNAIQITKGKTSLTSASPAVTRPVMGFCNITGSITVTWRSGDTSVVAAVAGSLIDLYQVDSVVVTTGTWSFQ
jgi:hypothetical protein